jgi:hypothetical protein
MAGERRLVVAVWEQLRSQFGSSRCKMVESHSNCVMLKKAHSLKLGRKLHHFYVLFDVQVK